jgi:ParB/Sulfiredoxin domain
MTSKPKPTPKPETPKTIAGARNRVKELRYVKADELKQHPQNWRKHPEHQRTALRGMLTEVGFASAVVAYETKDGLRIIDGHLRAETAGADEIPVLVVDIDDAEANKLLLTMDPLSAMAETDAGLLDKLLAETQTSIAAGQLMLDLHEQNLKDKKKLRTPQPSIQHEHLVQVICQDEAHQIEVFERLTNEGLECRLLCL